MSNKERATQVTTEPASREEKQQRRRITIAEARRKAFEASNKAQAVQIAYAEEEAKRWYDYRVEE